MDRPSPAPTAGCRPLHPKRHQSGELDWIGRIAKQGDATIRNLLDDAANSILTRSSRAFWLEEAGAEDFATKRAEEGRIALARRLGVIVHAMLRGGTLSEA